ncbi:MAG: helix-turn-helix transcriptional regulator [Flavobacteriales bacterium]|nr:helix-turn-helix transcriptional regulator [Flavobacteriales bacterium]
MNHLEELEYLNKLGARLKELRLEKGLTQSDCGIDDRTIRRIENTGEIFNPSFLSLVEIAKGMDIPLIELLNLEA